MWSCLNYLTPLSPIKLMASIGMFNSEHQPEQGVRELSIFEPPMYNISRASDKSLQWDPPADSDELAIALSYHFPVEKTLKSKMQAAMEKFLRGDGRKYLQNISAVEINKQEVKNSVNTKIKLDAAKGSCRRRAINNRIPKDDIDTLRISRPNKGLIQIFPDQNREKPRAPSYGSTAIPGLFSFDAKSLEEVKIKRRKRAYEKAERAEVGSNRGMACEIHRRQKLKCDPTKCLRNKKFQLSNEVKFAPHHVKDDKEHYTSPHLAELTILEKSSPKSRGMGLRDRSEIHQTESFPDNDSLTDRNVLGSTCTSNQLTQNETGQPSTSEHKSQFMGFEADFSTIDDPFSFRLENPFFRGDLHRSSWKPDNFVLSILRDSMYV